MDIGGLLRSRALRGISVRLAPLWPEKAPADPFCSPQRSVPETAFLAEQNLSPRRREDNGVLQEGGIGFAGVEAVNGVDASSFSTSDSESSYSDNGDEDTGGYERDRMSETLTFNNNMPDRSADRAAGENEFLSANNTTTELGSSTGNFDGLPRDVLDDSSEMKLGSFASPTSSLANSAALAVTSTSAAAPLEMGDAAGSSASTSPSSLSALTEREVRRKRRLERRRLRKLRLEPRWWFQSALSPTLRRAKGIAHVPDIEVIEVVTAESTCPPTPTDIVADDLNAGSLAVPQSVARIRLYLCGWEHMIGLKGRLTSSEQSRQEAKRMVSRVLQGIQVAGVELGFKIVFAGVDLSHTDASTRSIFFDTGVLARKATESSPVSERTRAQSALESPRLEHHVEDLDLSFTQTSMRALQNLHRVKHLRKLNLDHCLKLRKDRTSNASRVFQVLASHPVPSIRELSVVGTSNVMESGWMKHVQRACPDLEVLYFTRKREQKALGWDDAVLMQSVREPTLLPCGHIGDLDVVRQIKSRLCPFCRTRWNQASDLAPLQPHITKLELINVAACTKPLSDGSTQSGTRQWLAAIVDHYRMPLAGKCLVHLPCGEFFNPATVRQLYGSVLRLGGCGKSDDEMVDSRATRLLCARELVCGGCFGPFATNQLRPVFTSSVVRDQGQGAASPVGFDDLSSLQSYACDE